MTNFTPFQIESLQTTILSLIKMGEKFSKMVENTVGKGEIARYCYFTFSHSVFKRLVLQASKNQGLFGIGLIPRFTELY